MLVPLSILIGALLTVASAWAIGRSIFRRLPLELYRTEEYPLAFVAGSAVLSSIVFLLCSLGWARKGVFLAVALVAIGQASLPVWRRAVRPAFAPLPRRWLILFAAGFTIFTVLYFFSAMAPEFSPDGTSYHLSFVAQYARAHGFVRIPTNIYAQLSQGIELLFLMAFTFGRHSSAALVHYAFLIALTFAIVNYGRRTGYPAAGLAGALLVYASPVVGIDATSAYIDVAVACILFTVFYLLQLWDVQRRARLLVVIGLVAGFGYATKYTAGLAIPYAVGFVLWRTRRLMPAVVVGAAAFVTVAPWVVKNLLWAANPVAPMFNSLFPNPYVHIAFESGWTAYLRQYDLATRWSIPIEVTVRGGLGGLIGPIFLLLPLCLVALRIREGRRILAAAALFTLPYFANIGSRFLIPVLPFYAFSLALVLTEMQLALAAILVLHCILSWPSIVSLYCGPHSWMLGRIPLRQALRLESEDGWLSRKQPDYPIARLIERQVPPKQRVLAMSGVPESYTTREILVSFQSAAGEVAADIFYSAYTADYQPRCGERFQFPARRVRKIRLVQTHPREWILEWSIGELRLSATGTELARRPEWRLTAHPNPWEIQLAFDNSPVTRWRSRQPFDPGMWVEVDLGTEQNLDTVEADSPHDCVAHTLRLETMDASGKWSTVSASPQIVPLTPPQFMGKAAMRELKLRGIDYLFLPETDFGNPEVQENPAAWGLTEVGKAGNGRLYRLDAGYPVFEGEQHDTTISGR